jgi:hypothetical protein
VSVSDPNGLVAAAPDCFYQADLGQPMENPADAGGIQLGSLSDPRSAHGPMSERENS